MMAPLRGKQCFAILRCDRRTLQLLPGNPTEQAAMIRRNIWLLVVLLMLGPLTRSRGTRRACFAAKRTTSVLLELGFYLVAGLPATVYSIQTIGKNGVRARHCNMILLGISLYLLCALSALWSPSVLATLVKGLPLKPAGQTRIPDVPRENSAAIKLRWQYFSQRTRVTSALVSCALTPIIKLNRCALP
jgi:hypothetical protein